MRDLLRDNLRSALRHARRRPALAAAITLTLALVIAATATAVGLASAVLWRPLPFADADRLVFVWEAVGDSAARTPSRVTAFRYAAWRDAAGGLFVSSALFGAAGFTMDTPEGARSVQGVRASAGYFETLGIQAALGRTFAPDEEQPGRTEVVVLSDAFWREHLGARPDVLGQPILLSGRRYTVIGVMPPGVYPGWPVNPATVTIDPGSREFWVPIARTPEFDRSSRAHVFGVVARLAPGATPAQAVDALMAATDPTAPDAHGVHLSGLREQFVRDARTPLLALAGAVLAILLIACANLASLQVTSFEARRVEFATRAALGATTGRLVSQIAAEALTLTVSGAGIGLALAHSILAALPGLLPGSVPLMTPPAIDVRIAVFAVGLAAAAAAIITAWPVIRLMAGATAPRGVPPRGRGAVYRFLVVSQITVATALAVVAGLLGQSLWAVRATDPGFDLDRLFVAGIGLPATSPSDPRRIARAEQDVLDAVARAPGVGGAAVAYDHPLEANWSESPMVVGSVDAPESRRQAELRIVSPDYFETLGVDVLDGRALTPGDNLDAPGAVVVNEAFAGELGGRVLGRRIRSGTPRFQFADAPEEFEIVGVVRNERFRGLEAPALPAFYMSTRQFPQTTVVLLARTAGRPLDAASSIRATVRAADRAITFDNPRSMGQILSEQLVARRMTTGVIGGLAVAALAMAALGLYGLLAVLVASRTRESGIRLALGAAPRDLAGGIMRESLSCTLLGLTGGAGLALISARAMRSLLVGGTLADLWMLAAVSGTLLCVSMLAAAWPAVRAARVNPAEALRAE
jgi:putative ABC transport system permease protein